MVTEDTHAHVHVHGMAASSAAWLKCVDSFWVASVPATGLVDIPVVIPGNLGL